MKEICKEDMMDPARAAALQVALGQDEVLRAGDPLPPFFHQTYFWEPLYTFFEFKIEVDDITKDVSLIVTAFSEEDEIEESKMFWENQISELKHTIGA